MMVLCRIGPLQVPGKLPAACFCARQHAIRLKCWNGSKATFSTLRGDAGFTPNSDRLLRRHEVTRCAASGHHDRSEGTSLLRAYRQRSSAPLQCWPQFGAPFS